LQQSPAAAPKQRLCKTVKSSSGIGTNVRRENKRGSEKRSLNHATRYSFSRVSLFFVSASLVARVKAETRDKKTHEYGIYNIKSNEYL
jgi:hypothetical protein